MPSPSVNRPPVLTPVGSRTVAEGATLVFTVSASDPDGDTLTYAMSGLPAGASFDSKTGTFRWTPTYTQAGVYRVVVTVSDGSLTAEQGFSIVVQDVSS
ncbi:MAG: putative Ig domain-containing protein [Methanomicrobiales archaeon]|nr:putative Ig domain-containing protein [Methanomicrobiales archaeon]